MKKSISQRTSSRKRQPTVEARLGEENRKDQAGARKKRSDSRGRKHRLDLPLSPDSDDADALLKTPSIFSNANRQKSGKKSSSSRSRSSKSSSSSKKTPGSRSDSGNASIDLEEREHTIYDLDASHVTVGLCLHDERKTSSPKFTTPFNFRDGPNRGQDLVSIASLGTGSTTEEVESELDALLSAKGKKLMPHKTSNSKPRCRADPQMADPPGKCGSSRVTPTVAEAHWMHALTHVSYKNCDDEGDMADDESQSDPSSVILDLICVVGNIQDGTSTGQASRKRGTQDEELSLALCLLPPATNKDGTHVVAGEKDAQHVATLEPSADGGRVQWSLVCSTVLCAAVEDQRHKDKDGNSYVGKKSSLLLVEDFSKAQVKLLNSTEHLFSEAHRRVKAKSKPPEARDPKCAFLRLSVGKKKKTDEPWDDDEEPSIPSSQDDRVAALLSPEKAVKPRTARETREFDAEAPGEVVKFMKKLVSTDIDCNPFYHALTLEHWKACRRHWGNRTSIDGEWQLHIFEAYELDPEKPDTWPNIDLVAPEVHPSMTEDDGRCGGSIQRGAHEVQGNGLPKSHGEDPDVANEAGRNKAMERMAEGQVNAAAAVLALAKAKSGHFLAPDEMFVHVINTESERTVGISVPFSATKTVCTEIYDNRRPTDANVRSWSKEIVRSVRSKEKVVQIHLWNSLTNTSVLSWLVEELKTLAIAELFRAAPKDENNKPKEPIILHLVVEDVDAPSDTSVLWQTKRRWGISKLWS